MKEGAEPNSPTITEAPLDEANIPAWLEKVCVGGTDLEELDVRFVADLVTTLTPSRTLMRGRAEFYSACCELTTHIFDVRGVTFSLNASLTWLQIVRAARGVLRASPADKANDVRDHRKGLGVSSDGALLDTTAVLDGGVLPTAQR